MLSTPPMHSLGLPQNDSRLKRKRDTPDPDPEPSQKKRVMKGIRLRIDIPKLELIGTPASTAEFASYSYRSPSSSLFSSSSPSSLFDEPVASAVALPSQLPIHLALPPSPARITAPPIPGLFFPPVLLPQELADQVLRTCMETYFPSRKANQVMLFGRAPPSPSTSSPSHLTTGTNNTTTAFAPILITLLSTLSTLLRPLLPPHTYSLLFPETPRMARQAILNLYEPGEGISSHVDLLGRFGDGIMGVSFGSGCVMRFEEVEKKDANEDEEQERGKWDLYLPERSVIVLSEEARYKWTHGIEGRKEDYVRNDESNVNGSWIRREIRMSITFRWLLPGAEVVGDH